MGLQESCGEVQWAGVDVRNEQGRGTESHLSRTTIIDGKFSGGSLGSFGFGDLVKMKILYLALKDNNIDTFIR